MCFKEVSLVSLCSHGIFVVWWWSERMNLSGSWSQNWFFSDLDSGRGGAMVWTKKPLDREEHRFLTVDVELSDSQGLKNTQSFVIIIDDVNDNRMKPGKKTVYLWRTRVNNLNVYGGERTNVFFIKSFRHTS